MDKNATPRFSTVHYSVRRDLDIYFSEYILLDMVYHLSRKEGKCYKSLSSIGFDLGITFNGVKKMVGRLIEKGLLERHDEGLCVTDTYVDKAYFDGELSAISVDKKVNSVQHKRTEFSISALSSDKIYNRYTIDNKQKNKRASRETVEKARAKLEQQGILKPKPGISERGSR